MINNTLKQIEEIQTELLFWIYKYIPNGKTIPIFEDKFLELKKLVRQQTLEQLVEREKKEKKYHKEFECNGAYNGKGCFEDFCEDQNCRNAPKQWNEAKQDTISYLQSEIATLSTNIDKE